MGICFFNHLVLTGCEHELKAAKECLTRRSPKESKLHELGKRALSDQHASYLPDPGPGFQELAFQQLLPLPIEFQGGRDWSYWLFVLWGITNERILDNKSTGIVEGQIWYRFRTFGGVPLPWVRYLSSIFPTLGVAIHYASPNATVYRTTTFRGGVQIREEDYSAPDVSNAFMFTHFGWAPGSKYNPKKRESLIKFEKPLETFSDANIEQIKDANTLAQLRELHAYFQTLGLTAAGAYTLIARHARRIPEEMFEEMLDYPAAVAALSLRPSLPEPFAAFAAHKIVRRLVTEPIPQNVPPLSAEEDLANHEWYQRIQSWRRLLAKSLESHHQGLSRVDTELVFRRYQELNPYDDLESVLIYALAESLVRSPSTPARILEAMCPTKPSRFVELLAGHSNLTPRLCVKLLKLPMGLPAQAAVVFNPRLIKSPAVIRAMLKREMTWSFYADPEAVEVHRYTLYALASLAPVSELPAVFRAISRDPKFLLEVISSLPLERRAFVPPQAWTALLQSNERNVRQQAIVLLGSPQPPSTNLRPRSTRSSGN